MVFYFQEVKMTKTQEIVQIVLKDFLAFLDAKENRDLSAILLDKMENPSMYNDCQNNQDRS